MDRCLSDKYKYDGKKNAIPVSINNEPILALRLQDFILHEEAVNLKKYADLVFQNVDDNRRKKVAKVHNEMATKILCKRMVFKSLMIKGKGYTLSSFCPEILIVQWVKNKYLCNVDFDKLLGEQYIGNDNEQYITYVIAINPPGPHTTLTLREPNIDKVDFADIVLQERISIFYHTGSIKLSEVMDKSDRLHFYFRVKYTAL